MQTKLKHTHTETERHTHKHTRHGSHDKLIEIHWADCEASLQFSWVQFSIGRGQGGAGQGRESLCAATLPLSPFSVSSFRPAGYAGALAGRQTIANASNWQIQTQPQTHTHSHALSWIMYVCKCVSASLCVSCSPPSSSPCLRIVCFA